MSNNFLIEKYKDKVEMLENGSVLVQPEDWESISNHIYESKLYIMGIKL